WHYIKSNKIAPNKNVLKIKPFYDVRGKRILELGCFEGFDTFTLEQMQPKEVVSVEGRIENCLKCSFVKFLHELDRTTILYADLNKLDLAT
ncbi:unnamed protein product, partial [marine sediment metagenome]